MPINVIYFLMSSLLTLRTVSAFAVADMHTRRSALVSSCHLLISHRSNHRESAAARNRYARFRRRRSRLQMTPPDHDGDGSQLIAKDCMKLLSRRGKTWERLGDIVQLSISSSNGSETKSSIADIGTDHGLLAIALAATGRYEKVIGADVSEQALENGALSFYRKVQEALARDEDAEINDLPVEFRFGNGLSVLDGGEVSEIAIAGIGVNKLIHILNEDVTRVGASRLFLQPTNTKPANLIKLYTHLKGGGWFPKQELLKYISRRWYFSILFEKDSYANPIQSSESFDYLPGDKLRMIDNDDPMHREFMRYVDHHRQWLDRDLNAKGTLSEEEFRWFNVYGRALQ